MPLTTMRDWKGDPNVTPTMFDYLTFEAVPDSLGNLRRDQTWTQLFYAYLLSAYTTENLEFLEAVEDFKRQYPNGDPDEARTIFALFVKEGSDKEVNLPFALRSEVATKLAPDAPPAGADIFDASYTEIVRLTTADIVPRFIKIVNDVKKEANPSTDDSGDIYEDPEAMPPPPDITSGDADKWNDAALKAMREGDCTDFWELGGTPYVIVIKAQLDKPAPDYLTWARKYSNASGNITMTAKGSMFAKVNDNRGKVTVVGASDISGVKAAIGRFSQKEVVTG